MTEAASLGLVVMLLLAVGALLLALFVWGMIFRRAGYSFAMALLMFIPLVNFIWLLIFAFSKWPVQRELEAYRSGAPRAAPPAGRP